MEYLPSGDDVNRESLKYSESLGSQNDSGTKMSSCPVSPVPVREISGDLDVPHREKLVNSLVERREGEKSMEIGTP